MIALALPVGPSLPATTVLPATPAVGVANAAMIALAACWLAGSTRRVGRAVVRAQVRRRLPGRAAGPAPVHHPGPSVSGGWAPGWFTRRVTSMALATPPVILWRRWCLLVPSATVLGAAAGGAVGAGLGAGAALVLPLIVGDVLGGRADRLVDAALPGLLDQVGGGLRAGLSLTAALGAAVPRLEGPLRDDIGAVSASLGAGAPMAMALGRWRRRRPTPGVALATTALSLSAVLGGRSRPLDGVASTLRDRLAVERELRAVCTQSRASAAVLVVLPWAFTAYAAAQDPGSLAVFTDSPIGIGCLLVGATLDVAGAWIMVRLVGRVA
jgi:tight adherence protein B